MGLHPNRLKVLRAERALSQMELAQRAKIHVNKYWRIENGYADPTSDERVAIAKVFGIPEPDVFPIEVGQ